MNLGIISVMFPYGTKEPYLEAELRGLLQRGCRVTVLPVAPRTGKACFRLFGAGKVALPLFSPRVLADALREIRRHPLAVGAVVRDLAASRSRARVKLKNLLALPKALALCRYVRERRIEHVHAYWLSVPATVAYVVARLTGITWSATAHRWDIYEGNALDLKLPSARFVRAISRRGRDALCERAVSNGAGTIVHVPLGVATPAPGMRAARGSALRLLCPAALVPIKGHATLLEALAIARRDGVDVRCTLAGGGPLRRYLERHARRLGLENALAFEGHVEHARLLERLRSGAFDGVVLASRQGGEGFMEGLPAALIEAMFLQVPCIATDSGSIGELLDERTGWLVPSGDARALAAAIGALAADPAQGARRAAAARSRVLAAHDLSHTSRLLAAHLRSAGSAPERLLA